MLSFVVSLLLSTLSDMSLISKKNFGSCNVNLFIWTKSEKTEALKGRPSIFAKKKILKNEFFTLKNLKIVRPNLGLPPKNFNKLLKKKAKKNILEDEPIFWSSIKWKKY